jgi:hypothetical protein
MEKQGTPNLPLYFTILDTFLENVKVSPAQQKDLVKARDALKAILLVVYGAGDTRQRCSGPVLFFPPIA